MTRITQKCLEYNRFHQLLQGQMNRRLHSINIEKSVNSIYCDKINIILFNLQRIVVFPALSKPKIKIRTSFDPKSDWKIRLKSIPIIYYVLNIYYNTTEFNLKPSSYKKHATNNSVSCIYDKKLLDNFFLNKNYNYLQTYLKFFYEVNNSFVIKLFTTLKYFLCR